ncbi:MULTISPECIES: hypothetical protein [Pseudomonas]|uniref:Uncharacterized protein n=1 Tax=Pseudomonas donghuensis TaxID=1163398 RepID=A0AAP0X8B1_9PSED|nr:MULTISPECIES: hypothetical protein [Pseudomonas]MDF9894192.1 hypothetical protein [Pseudomonas vranovensis]KDN98498.1 hypothetical protein BV82_3617 [Pseudomonas donghuensis]MBF4210953.1 hypothetical protein [Pseudomonas donghuensis]MBS7596625.1 hypothetical protein [Pseudomonas sp. RC2C2]MCP6694786.1 hypothetical protein [Pseudomonas donghuensis]
MVDLFNEDNGDAFPINNLIRCGQSGYRLGFTNMTQEDAQVRLNTLPRSKKGKFTPRLPAKK